MKSQPTSRERYRHHLRRTILDAARDAFAENGYEGVSMRLLAKRVGCTHGNIYLHFKDKTEIFDCLVEESFRQLAELLQQKQAAKATDPVRFLKKAALAYVEFGLRNPGAYEFAFVLRRPGRPRSAKPHLAYELMRSVVGRCVEEGRLRKMDVDTASQAVWAAVHGVTSLLICRPSFPWSDKDKVVRLVIDGAIDSLVVTPAKRSSRAPARPRSLISSR